ncbi:MAG: hypothetical protein KME30_32385 [Iphinoe sp. HA4291-MV1]|jgi:hypothetical protein|nr:hypothetical protein [Iphinoe sp. HA4291-MV1]
MNPPSNTPNVLIPNKRFSQLIAKSWLDGKKLSIDKNFLVQEGIFLEEEIKFFEVEVGDLSFPGEVGLLDIRQMKIYISSSLERPSQATDELLQQWVNEDTNSPPWILKDENNEVIIQPLLRRLLVFGE